MSERSHRHTEGTVHLPIIFDVLRFNGFSVLVNYSVYIHPYSTYVHTVILFWVDIVLVWC